MRLIGVLLVLSGCAGSIPTPEYYCPSTCEVAGEWHSTMLDPNDPNRIAWCVCTTDVPGRLVGIPPRDPEDE